MVRTSHKNYTTGAKGYDSREQDRGYIWEVRDIEFWIKRMKKSKGKTLLDVGCGTGTHLSLLQDKYSCSGIDLHKEMIAVARKKLKKKVDLHVGSMVDFDLGKQFDIIISLYSVINYAESYRDFRKTLKNFYNHLKKGGVCIIEPYFSVQILKHDRGSANTKDLLPHEIGKWSRIMREVGFTVKYLHSGLNQKAKGLYVLVK